MEAKKYRYNKKPAKKQANKTALGKTLIQISENIIYISAPNIKVSGLENHQVLVSNAN